MKCLSLSFRFKTRAVMVILTTGITGALSPVVADVPGRADPPVFNRCELNLTENDAPSAMRRAPSSIHRPRITAISLPGGLQALPSTTPSWSYETNRSGEHVGVALSTGDLTGDGIDDLFVAATGYSNGEFEEGRAYLFHGSPSGLSASPDWTFESNVPEAHFPHAGGIVTDVNGDGVDDLLMSSA